MYAEEVVHRNIEAKCAELRAKGETWKPVRHTTRQIEHAVAHFNDLYDWEQKRIRRALKPDEANFIQNERWLCKLDYNYWTEHYAWIVDWSKNPVRFTPNVAQQIIRHLWEDRERQGLAIWMQQLKARRLGASTESEMAVQHRFQFYPYSNCVVASADPEKTVQMAGMIGFCWEKQPWWLLPTVSKVHRGLPAECKDIHTTLSIQAGNQFNGVARGATPSVIHLSELASWVDAEELVDAALMRAVIDSPNVLGILESTAWGTGTWWHRTWEQNKRDFQRGRARVIPIFLPWFIGTDLYPSATDLLARPIPADWSPSDRTIRHAERARSYVTSNPLLFEYFSHGNKEWRMPREQMWFYEIEYDTAKEKKQLNTWLSEMPGDDFEAFQSPNMPVIDPEILMSYEERTRAPLGVYTLIGPDIPPSLVVPSRYRDTSKPVIPIRTRDLLPKFDVTYQLVPVQFHGYPSFDPTMKILLWEHPQDGFSYGLGCDTSEGIGQDNAVIQAMREATIDDPPAQVAEFAYDFVTAFQLWPFVMALSVYYSTWSPTAGQRGQCRSAIECWANGAVVQNEMQKRGWHNFHPWKSYDNRRPRADGQVNKMGVYTNVTFRAQMMDMLLTALSEEAIDLPSPYLIQELKSLEKEVGTRKAQASYGSHDDRVMGIGFPLFSLHMGKPAHKQYARKRVQYVPGMTEPGVSHPRWAPPSHTMSSAFQPPAQRIFSNQRQGALQRYVNTGMPEGFR